MVVILANFASRSTCATGIAKADCVPASNLEPSCTINARTEVNARC